MKHIAKTIEAVLFHLARDEDWDQVKSYGSWLNELAKVNFSDHATSEITPIHF